MLGFNFQTNSGLLILPALLVGYAVTNHILQFMNMGITSKTDINVLDYQLSVLWAIGKTMKDE
jgi:hypothetical protein